MILRSGKFAITVIYNFSIDQWMLIFSNTRYWTIELLKPVERKKAHLLNFQGQNRDSSSKKMLDSVATNKTECLGLALLWGISSILLVRDIIFSKTRSAVWEDPDFFHRFLFLFYSTAFIGFFFPVLDSRCNSRNLRGDETSKIWDVYYTIPTQQWKMAVFAFFELNIEKKVSSRSSFESIHCVLLKWKIVFAQFLKRSISWKFVSKWSFQFPNSKNASFAFFHFQVRIAWASQIKFQI